MKVYNAKLGREIEVPEGWYVVEAGGTRQGDQAWRDDGVTAGEFGPVTIYNLGHDVRDFWCVIRPWNEAGGGI